MAISSFRIPGRKAVNSGMGYVQFAHTPFFYQGRVMQHALFEVLTGCYSSGQPIERFARASDVQMSIMDHLTRLLNARQGCMVHDPEYGLPDIGRIYQAGC